MSAVEVCLGKMCDWRDHCSRHIHNLRCGVGHVAYKQPQKTGEFCDWYLAEKRDSDPKEVQP